MTRMLIITIKITIIIITIIIRIILVITIIMTTPIKRTILIQNFPRYLESCILQKKKKPAIFN